MNLAEAANLVLTLSLKDQVSSGLKGIEGRMGTLNAKSATLQGGLGKIGKGIGKGLKTSAVIGGAGLLFLVNQIGKGIDSLIELEDVGNQTDAVIKSTGSSAGLTADDIRTLAEEMEDLSGVDDKVIQSGANVLLTFTNIREDAFEPATLAALNMSQAMDQDLQSSMVQIGKALNDPIKGMTALTRVGVTFSDEQKEVIKKLVETGDVAGAQRVILAELNKEFGGSAQASMEGYRGTQLKLQDAVEDLQMALAEALLPAIRKVSEKLTVFLKDPVVKEGIRKLGQSIAGIFSDENVKGGGSALKGLFNFLKELPWGQIKDGLSFAAENAKKVVDVFRSLPPGVQAGLLTFLAANKLTGGLVASGLGELLKVGLSSLRTITAANVTVVGTNVVGGPGGAGPGGVGGIPAVIPIVAIAATSIVALNEVVPYAERNNELSRLGLTQLEINALRLNEIKGQQGANRATVLEGNRDANARAANLASALEKIRGGGAQTAVNTQRAALISSEVRDRIGLSNTKLAVITGQGADHREALRAIYQRAQEQKQLTSIGNHAMSEAKERLGSIQVSSQRTAQKDLSVNVTTRVVLNVAGRQMAEAMDHFRRTQGGQV